MNKGELSNRIHPWAMKWDKNQISKKIWLLIFTETLQLHALGDNKKGRAI
jgi:hypothetical protein